MNNKLLDKRNAGAARGYHAAWILLIVLTGAAYMLTLYPGVGQGDRAEMQLMCALLGTAHPPGYCLEIVAGKMFSLLPIGAGVAWRVNFMQTVCGLVGIVTLFAVLRRLTGQNVPALVGAMTLAFSNVYWMHSVAAEVYVFHSMFLLLGLYYLVRFEQSEKAGWLYLAALMLGICIGNRLSEAFVLPGVLLLIKPMRSLARLNWKRLCTAGVLFLSPFAFNVGYYAVRENSALLHARDDARRDEILGVSVMTSETPLVRRLVQALRYTTGVSAAGRQDFTAFSWERVGWDIDKFAWHISGLALFGDRFSPEQRDQDPLLAFRHREQGSGAAIGLLGVLLALLGFRRWRTHAYVVSAGSAMFAGNFLYYLYMHPVDNLHFTIPGLIGLAMLIGLGVSTRQRSSPKPTVRRVVLQGACLIVPALLLLTNYDVMDYRSPEYTQSTALAEKVKTTALPGNTTIVATYSRAQRLRYLYWVESGRVDVRVIVYRERYGKEELRQLVEGLRNDGRYILFSSEAVGNEATLRKFERWTPREFVEIGLYQPFPIRRGEQ